MLDTAEYSQQTTLSLPAGDAQEQQLHSDGRHSTTGSQSLLAASGSATAAGDVVVNIDEKQPLICRHDHIVTIDTVRTSFVHRFYVEFLCTIYITS